MKYALVVDLGATNLRIAIVNSKHEIVKKVKVSTNKNEDIAYRIYKEFKNLNFVCILEGIVVGVPGSIDYKNNIIRDLPNLGIKGYDLEKNLSNLFNLPVKILNDASLACIGEYSLYKEEKVFQYITISSGIGGGLIYKQELFEGSNGFEQEIGRMFLKEDLFENLCSGNALKKRLLNVGIEEEYPSNAIICDNEECKKVVNEWLDDLSEGIANIVKILNPSMIVFGGGIGSYIDYYKEGLLERMNKQLPEDVLKDLKINKSFYGDDSAIVGGSYLIFQDN